MNSSDILKRIDELLAAETSGRENPQLPHACVSLLTLVYGPNSSHLAHFNTRLAEIHRRPASPSWHSEQVSVEAKGTLKNLKTEIELGLIGSLRQQITGEVLTDLLQLARTVLDQPGDNAKNVAAVLTAAAFEDTIRRMGQTLAGVIGQDDLADVLKKLKEADVVKSPQVGIAQSYLSFRNHALHANWNSIQREAVQSVLGFVEQLLLKHFS